MSQDVLNYVVVNTREFIAEPNSVYYTNIRADETTAQSVCRLLRAKNTLYT